MNRAITWMGFAFLIIGVLILAGYWIGSTALSHGISSGSARIGSSSFGDMGWVLMVLGLAIAVVGYLSGD